VIRTAHTAELTAADLSAARALFDEAFAGEFTDDDWEHCLGGVHALAYDGEELTGHGAVVLRRMLHGGRALRCGYVEGVAVRHRRRGTGRAVVETLHGVLAAYDLGALASTDAGLPFYAALGWQAWRGPLRALTPAGLVDTPEEAGGVFVRPGAVPLDLDAPLVCDYRDGDLW
jgi:aminoglycoside 2'-N-acetyltransferase I